MNERMEASKQILEVLSKPFGIDEIEWRVQTVTENQKGTRVLALPYITSRAVLNRLDEACGGYWQSEYNKITVGNIEAFQCSISIKVGDEWVSRADAAEVSDIESVKGGHSNALKRAGVQWGIGRYLYELKPFWIPVEQRGEHYFGGQFNVGGNKKYVKGYFNTPQLPGWALPNQSGKQPRQESRPTTKQQPQNNNQNNSQSTSKPSNLQKPSNQQNDVTKKQPIDVVTELLHSLNVPVEYLAALLKKSSGCIVPLEDANVDQLRSLHAVLDPVDRYVNNCRSIGLDDERMLYYAQIVLKQPLESIHSLYFKLDKEMTKKTLELIHEDLKIPSQQTS